MRKHGWQPPFHSFQANHGNCSVLHSGILVLRVLRSVSGVDRVEGFDNGPVLFTLGAVFILYVACSWINPVDPRVYQSLTKCSPTKEAGSEDELAGELREQKKSLNKCEHRSPDCCQRHLQELDPEEELFYCSICDADISAYSKHCRACDKCVHGFDHHCRWLNNCVGTRNYKPFVALMVSCLLMLIMAWAVGIVVLVRCFNNRTSFDQEIRDQLGRSFPRAAFVAVLIILMLLAFLATAPLMQLFCFHLILMHKGITTYDYILTVRDENQELWDGSSLTSSAATSTETGFSSYNSAASKRIVPCIPPRMFVDQDQTMMALGEQEVGGGKRRIISAKANQKVPGLNPWKLAAVDREDATRAAARARAKSSILHLTRPEVHFADDSLRSSSADEIHLAGRPRISPSPLNSSLKLLPPELPSPFRANEEFTGNPRASFPAPQAPFAPQFRFLTEQFPHPVTSDVVRVSVNSDGYEASCGESFEDTSVSRSFNGPEPWVARFESPASTGSRLEASILKAYPELQQARSQSSSPPLYEESPLRESTDFTTTSNGETQDRRIVSAFFYSGFESASIRATMERRGVSQRMPVNSIIAPSRVIDESNLSN